MKKLKQVIAQLAETPESSEAYTDLLWQYICYSPKMPLRLAQENLLGEAKHSSLQVHDAYYTHADLQFNIWQWGEGPVTVLLVHGWGSKAADWIDTITALRSMGNLRIIAFDAPGNGSSEGELSNLLLFVEAIKAVVGRYGNPDVMIGHSLGAMANVVAAGALKASPALLISLAPLVRLQENFERSMHMAGVSPGRQAEFLQVFANRFQLPASHFVLNRFYSELSVQRHWLAYDAQDPVSPYAYLQQLLAEHPEIESHNFEGAGHAGILKQAEVVESIVNEVERLLTR